jgi:hypothetical protein
VRSLPALRGRPRIAFNLVTPKVAAATVGGWLRNFYSTTDYTDITDGVIHEQLSGKIIGAAMEVLNELKPGLDEKLYERALIIELKRRGHGLSIQRSFPVFYRGE